MFESTRILEKTRISAILMVCKARSKNRWISEGKKYLTLLQRLHKYIFHISQIASLFFICLQFMAVHIYNISAILLRSGTPGYLVHATATEMHLDGSVVQNAKTLLVNVDLSEASAKVLRHSEKRVEEETCLAEINFAFITEVTFFAQGPLSVEVIQVFCKFCEPLIYCFVEVAYHYYTNKCYN